MKNKKKLLKVIVLVGIPLVFKNLLEEYWIVAFLIYALIISVISPIMDKGYRNRCPFCKKWFSKVITNKELIDSIGGRYSTVTRHDYRKNRYGNIIGSTERQEQVHITTNFYKVHCVCKFCKKKYNYETHSTFEG